MIKKKDVLFQDYSNLLTEIKQRINKAQYEALKVVNRELIVLYWDMGKLIFQYLQTGSWGDSLINKLAHDLQKTFPGARGYSARNLRYIVDFYSNYKENAKLQSLIAKISWTHNIILLDRCSDILEREFYIRMSAKHGWSSGCFMNFIDIRHMKKLCLVKPILIKICLKTFVIKPS